MSDVASVARMLIVDDEPRMTESVKATLQGQGCEIETSNSSKEALAKLQTAVYDVALLDVKMPGLSGYQILDKLDRDEVQTVFIIMTGEASLDSAIEAVRRGASDYVRKPFEPDELLIRVGNAFKQKQLKDERRQIEAENRSLEMQLRQSQKMEAIGTLAGGIAHDFNNILSIILGNTELVRAATPQWDETREHLDKVLTASNRAKEMINQLLSFTRKTESERIPIELKTIIRESMKLLRASLPAKIVIRQQLPNTSFIVEGDSTQIHQIMINLCTNAAHALDPTGGVLEVNLESVSLDSAAAGVHGLEPGPFVMLSVSDTGHGIDPTIRERIFDPYFTTKGPGEGTGMGLAVVHGIVKNHGGAIEVTSEPNVKTEFRVFLPVVEAEAVQTIAAAEEALPTGEERILLVDDEEMVADIVRQMVSKLGYRVDAFTDSRTALQTFRQYPDRFDLILTDMTMPNLTGKQLAEEVKAVRLDIPIILCSGHQDEFDTADACNIGITEFARKPLSMQQLAQIIRRVLDGRQIDRRRSPRFVANSGAFVISRADPSSRGELLDISLSGLSFRYLDAAQNFGRVDELALCTEDNRFVVDNLKVKTVFDLKTDGAQKPNSSVQHRCGVQFEELTMSQMEQLRYFIQNNASRVTN
jgi:signal transduction histidine kinase